jgi:hypothetical protein
MPLEHRAEGAAQREHKGENREAHPPRRAREQQPPDCKQRQRAAITTKTTTLRIWKSNDDHSRAIPATAAPTPRITIAGHHRIGGVLEESFIASALSRQAPGDPFRNQTGQTITLKGVSKA